jgi:hypothetical protein
MDCLERLVNLAHLAQLERLAFLDCLVARVMLVSLDLMGVKEVQDFLVFQGRKVNLDLVVQVRKVMLGSRVLLDQQDFQG